MTPTQPPAKRKSELLWLLLPIGLWMGATSIVYFGAPNDGPKHSEYIPFYIFYGWSFLGVCALLGAAAIFGLLITLYKKWQEAMEKELENERMAESQVTPFRKTKKILQSTFFIGVMPIVISFAVCRLLLYLYQYDTESDFWKILGIVIFVGIAYFISFIIGMGLTGRRVDLSDQGFVAQFFGRIGIFIMNAIILGILIFAMRSCGH